MCKELADITIKFKELENVVFDEIIEFLEDQKIQYEIIDVNNRITEYIENERDYHEEYENNMLVQGIDIYDRE